MAREASINVSRPLGAVKPKPRDLTRPASMPANFCALLERANCAELLARDDVVIPAVEDREGYNPGEDFQYWLTGFSDYANISQLLPPGWLEEDLSILDFGGCSGRVARHFLAARPATQMTIAEANVNYVNWVNNYFSKNCRAVRVGPQPHIPLPDDSFDFAFALSVFTHINDDELRWLRELTRVVKPNGYLYVTILSENSWEAMDMPSLLVTIKADDDSNRSLAAAVGGPMPCERFSVALEFNEAVNNCNTFQSSAYVRRVWNELATIERIAPLHHGYQTAVLLKNDRKVAS